MRQRSAFLLLESRGLVRRIHATEAADLVGVNVRQVRAWLRGEAIPPAPTWRLLEILALGIMPWPGWERCSVDPTNGRLHTNNGYAWSPGQLTHWGLEMQRWQSRLNAAGAADRPPP